MDEKTIRLINIKIAQEKNKVISDFLAKVKDYSLYKKIRLIMSILFNKNFNAF